MSFVERSIILCHYLGGSTIGGSTVVIFVSNNVPLVSLIDHTHTVLNTERKLSTID